MPNTIAAASAAAVGSQLGDTAAAIVIVQGILPGTVAVTGDMIFAIVVESMTVAVRIEVVKSFVDSELEYIMLILATEVLTIAARLGFEQTTMSRIQATPRVKEDFLKATVGFAATWKRKYHCFECQLFSKALNFAA